VSLNGIADMKYWVVRGMWVRSRSTPARATPRSRPGGSAVACWFWGEADFAPGRYKAMIDLMNQHTSFTLLTASFRAGRREPLTDPAVFEQVKQAVAYARSKGIGIAPEFSMWSDLTGLPGLSVNCIASATPRSNKPSIAQRRPSCLAIRPH